MARALWQGTVLAEAGADDVVAVEGNVYFPAGAVRREHLRPRDTHTGCPRLLGNSRPPTCLTRVDRLRWDVSPARCGSAHSPTGPHS